jgi:diguanylate cyclase (GGDEF)-like protein
MLMPSRLNSPSLGIGIICPFSPWEATFRTVNRNAFSLMTMDADLSADHVARAQRKRRWTLTFPPEVEARFEADTATRRLQVLRIVMIRTVVIYNLFLVGDYLLARDSLGLSLVLHFGLVTPWILIVLASIRRSTPPVIRNLLVASVPLAMIGGIIAVFSVSRHIDVTHYQYFIVITVMFGNVVLRPGFAYAVAASVAAVFAHAAACFLHPMMPTSVAVIAVFSLIVSAGVTLLAGYSIERDMRRAYLMRLKDQLAQRDLQRTAETLEQISNIDPLTGLANRRGVDAQVAALFRSGEGGRPFCVLMVDVDHFKGFNDRYGHRHGDTCLTHVAAAVSGAVGGPRDIVGRFGGEEFIAILPDASLGEATRIAERMRLTLERLAIPHAGSPFGVATISIGVGAGTVGDIVHLGHAIDTADAALYAAKAAGRNRVFPPSAAGRSEGPKSSRAA